MGTSVQGGGLDQIIRLISTMSEMQNRKKEIAQREEEMQIQREQIAQSFGLQEKTQKWKDLVEALDKLTTAAPESRDSLTELFSSALGPDTGRLLSQVAHMTPETREQVRDRMIRAGAPNVDSTAVASQALTGNLPGAVTQDALSGNVAGAAQQVLNQDPTRRAQVGGDVLDKLSGTNALSRMVQNAILQDPKLRSDYLASQTGGITSALGEELAVKNREAATGEAAVRTQMIGHELTAAIAGVRINNQGKANNQVLANLKVLLPYAKLADDQKVARNIRMQNMLHYNQLADQLGFPNMKYTNLDDSKGGLLDGLIDAYGPTGIIGSQLPTIGLPGNPGSPVTPGGTFDISPFLRRNP